MLLPDIQELAARSVLCWLATVDEAGQPNVSPKEIFAVFDSTHLVIANIASPASVRNIQAKPRVCVSLIDVFVQKGFKLIGLARNVSRRDAEFPIWAAPLEVKAGPRFPIHSVLVIQVTSVEPILAPSYRLYPAETTESEQIASAMRAYHVQPQTPPAPQRMQLNQVTVPALDVERSIAFYQGLGLRLIVKALPHYARFEGPNGGASFSLDHVERAPASPGIVVYFECDDLDNRVRELQSRGYTFTQEPRDETWLWREARLTDPSGNVICLYRAGENRLNPPWRIA